MPVAALFSVPVFADIAAPQPSTIQQVPTTPKMNKIVSSKVLTPRMPLAEMNNRILDSPKSIKGPVIKTKTASLVQPTPEKENFMVSGRHAPYVAAATPVAMKAAPMEAVKSPRVLLPAVQTPKQSPVMTLSTPMRGTFVRSYFAHLSRFPLDKSGIGRGE